MDCKECIHANVCKFREEKEKKDAQIEKDSDFENGIYVVKVECKCYVNKKYSSIIRKGE